MQVDEVRQHWLQGPNKRPLAKRSMAGGQISEQGQECMRGKRGWRGTLGVKTAVVMVTTTGRCTSAHSGMLTCRRISSRGQPPPLLLSQLQARVYFRAIMLRAHQA